MMTALADAGLKTGETTPSVGQLLRARRIELGLDLSDIARETRVSHHYLAAIEDDKQEDLPSLTFALGFTKNYAKAVGLSAEDIGAQYKSEYARYGIAPEIQVYDPLDETKIPSRKWLAIGVGGAFLALGGWWALSSGMFGTSSSEMAATPSVEPEESVTPTQTSPVTAATPSPTLNAEDPSLSPPTIATPDATALGEAQAAAAAKVVGSGPVVIHALEDSWVKVADGETGSVKIGIMKAGETYQVPALPGLKLLTGNAGAIEIIVGGKTLPPLGEKGEVVKGLSLDPTDLAKMLQSSPIPAAKPAATLPPIP